MIAKPGTIKINKNKDLQQYKILVLGEANVGKSSLVDRCIQKDFSDKYNPTIAVDFKHFQPAQNLSFNFWDFSGHPEFVEVRNEFYKDANLLILVFDLTVRATMVALDSWFREASDYGAGNVPVVVIGNKKEKRNMLESEGQNWAKSRGFQYIECSAAQNQNINVLVNMIREILTK
ncbi:hypothetical protein pb186bvf_005902 [Paramecium bursaria]